MSWKNNENHGSTLTKWHPLVRRKDGKSVEYGQVIKAKR